MQFGRQFRIDQAVQPADEDAGDRGDAVHRQAGSETLLDAGAIGLLHVGELPRRKDQRDIDVDAVGDGGGDRAQAGRRCRDLDHRVRTADLRPQSPGGSQGAGGVGGQGRRHLEADETGITAALLVQGQEQVAGALDVGERQGFEAQFGLQWAVLELAHGFGVSRIGADRVVEDGRVRGDAGNRIVGDPAGEFAGFEQLAGQVVEPDLLAEAGDGGNAGHVVGSLGKRGKSISLCA